MERARDPFDLVFGLREEMAGLRATTTQEQQLEEPVIEAA
jgi:hypothetical protein